MLKLVQHDNGWGNMLLAIDIGNTNIHNGIFNGRVLVKDFRISTYSGELTLVYTKKLRPYLKKIDLIVVASVVPEVLKRVEKILHKIFNKKVIVIGRDIDSGVKNLYTKPQQVGQDRLVNARAAYELYGGECIIVDFGTAITIDIVNKHKEYLGGVIACGPGLSLWALSEKTALLPKVNMKKPRRFLGKETRESMVIGAVYGFSSLCDGLVAKLKKRYCKFPKVIATGGFSRLIGPYCESVDRIDPNLTLKGLELIGEELIE